MTSENEKLRQKGQDWDKNKKWKDTQPVKKDEIGKEDLRGQGDALKKVNIDKKDFGQGNERLNKTEFDDQYKFQNMNDPNRMNIGGTTGSTGLSGRNDLNRNDMDRNDMNRNDLNRNDMDRNDLNRNDMNRNDLNRNDMNRSDMNRTDLNRNDMNRNDMNRNDMNRNDMNRNDMNRSDINRSSDTTRVSDVTGVPSTMGTGVTGTSGLSGNTSGTFTTGKSDFESRESGGRSNENPYMYSSQNEQLDKSKVDPNDPNLKKELKEQHVGLGTNLEDETKRKTNMGNIQSH